MRAQLTYATASEVHSQLKAMGLALAIELVASACVYVVMRS